MRSLALILIVAATAAAESGGGVVTRPRVDDGDWWNDGVKLPYSFGQLDGDGDGRVGGAEWEAGRRQLERALKETRAGIQEALDRDDSGKVSRYESAEGQPRFRSIYGQARALAIAANDKDGDGMLSDAERAPIVARVREVLAATGARVPAATPGHPTGDETLAVMRAVVSNEGAMFSVCDRDNDGQLSTQELDIAFRVIRAAAGP